MTKEVVLNIRITPEQDVKLAKMCKESDETRSEVVRDLISSYFYYEPTTDAGKQDERQKKAIVSISELLFELGLAGNKRAMNLYCDFVGVTAEDLRDGYRRARARLNPDELAVFDRAEKDYKSKHPEVTMDI